MTGKTPTNEELVALGRKLWESREKQRAEGKERRKAKVILYKMWKAGDRTPIGDIKI